MNDEKNTTDNSPETSDARKEELFPTKNTETSTDSDAAADDYYAVDHAKKDVISTIGDGEMHNEGLVGTGEETIDLQTSTERMTDEQDAAESHDSEQ